MCLDVNCITNGGHADFAVVHSILCVVMYRFNDYCYTSASDIHFWMLYGAITSSAIIHYCSDFIMFSYSFCL